MLFLSANAAYKKQLKNEQDLLAQEEKMKDIFGQQFQQGDKNYWVKTIAELKAKTAAKNLEAAMNQRLLLTCRWLFILLVIG